MKKPSILLSLFIVLGMFIANISFAQFEGVIYFDKVKSETTKYIYYVKGKKVRIDEFGADGTSKGIMLIDMDKNTYIPLDPNRKLWMDGPEHKAFVAPTVTINKTTNKEKINGVECVEWIARSEAEGTEISHWVILEDKYSFFEPMLRTLNRKDRVSTYFLQYPDIKNKFTMKAVEKSLDGTVRMSLEVTKMEPKSIPNSTFEIPSDFVKFEK